MAVCPFAIHKLIAPGSNDPRIHPRAVILHVADMLGPSLFDFFAHRSGGIESHFYIRLTGELEQYRDTDFQADANLDANDFAVSIETEGRAAGEWTPAQIATIERLLTWLHVTHPAIPLRKIQNWNGSGIGYHTLFGSPSHWTPVQKSCPGPDRKRQFDRVLVPWLDGPTMSIPAAPADRALPTVSLAGLLAAARHDIPGKQGTTLHPKWVARVEQALAAERLLSTRYASDGSWGTSTRDAYRAWQKRLGYTGSDADGVPGLTSLTALGKRHGFRATP